MTEGITGEKKQRRQVTTSATPTSKTATTKKNRGSYLLLHRSGVIAKTKTLTTSQPVDGIMTIINLDTLEQYDGERWEKIPDGYDHLIEAEQELSEEEEDQEFDDSYADDDVSPDAIQLGARRYFNPNLVWAYCKMKTSSKT